MTARTKTASEGSFPLRPPLDIDPAIAGDTKVVRALQIESPEGAPPPPKWLRLSLVGALVVIGLAIVLALVIGYFFGGTAGIAAGVIGLLAYLGVAASPTWLAFLLREKDVEQVAKRVHGERDDRRGLEASDE